MLLLSRSTCMVLPCDWSAGLRWSPGRAPIGWAGHVTGTSGGAGLGFPLKSMKVRQQRWAELEPPLAPWPGPGPLRASPPMWSHYWNTIPSTMQTGLKCNKYTLYRRHDFSSGLFMSIQIRFTNLFLRTQDAKSSRLLKQQKRFIIMLVTGLDTRNIFIR